jgi:hypothetical protein
MAIFQRIRAKVNVDGGQDTLEIFNYDTMTSIVIHTNELDELISYLKKQKVQIKKDDQIQK